MNHQYLRIYEKSREVIPRLKIPFERTIFIGYNHLKKRYLVYKLTVHGGDGPLVPEGFSYGERTGNELKVVLINGSDLVINQRFIWEPESGSWNLRTDLDLVWDALAPQTMAGLQQMTKIDSGVAYIYK